MICAEGLSLMARMNKDPDISRNKQPARSVRQTRLDRGNYRTGESDIFH